MNVHIYVGRRALFVVNQRFQCARFLRHERIWTGIIARTGVLLKSGRETAVHIHAALDERIRRIIAVGAASAWTIVCRAADNAVRIDIRNHSHRPSAIGNRRSIGGQLFQQLHGNPYQFIAVSIPIIFPAMDGKV